MLTSWVPGLVSSSSLPSCGTRILRPAMRQGSTQHLLRCHAERTIPANAAAGSKQHGELHGMDMANSRRFARVGALAHAPAATSQSTAADALRRAMAFFKYARHHRASDLLAAPALSHAVCRRVIDHLLNQVLVDSLANRCWPGLCSACRCLGVQGHGCSKLFALPRAAAGSNALLCGPTRRYRA